MRLIHTSDWHLGQTLHNYERAYEHQCFLDWLTDTVVAEQADALLIAGDVFDTANPSASAQKQLYRFLQQVRAPQLDIVIIMLSNHDSPGRLEAPGPLLESHGTRHRPRAAQGRWRDRPRTADRAAPRTQRRRRRLVPGGPVSAPRRRAARRPGRGRGARRRSLPG
ncbi:exonuclease subunit SbcD [Massilia sp. B-10]|nr:exonuclease subunit SbcD [Massilia sp. B-10]